MKKNTFFIFLTVALIHSFITKACEKQWQSINPIIFSRCITSPQPLLALAATKGSGWDDVISWQGENSPFYINITNLLKKLPEGNRSGYTSAEVEKILNYQITNSEHCSETEKNQIETALDEQALLFYTVLIPILFQDKVFIHFALKEDSNFLGRYARETAYSFQKVALEKNLSQRLYLTLQQKPIKYRQNSTKQLLNEKNDNSYFTL